MTTKHDNSDYEKQKADLIKRVNELPDWRKRMYFAKLRELGIVSITEKDFKKKPRLYVVK